MLSNDAEQILDMVFEAFANSKRRAMLHTLSFRPATVSELAEEQGLSLPAIHRHIRVLEQAQLVQRRKVGRVNFVALKRESFATAKAWMAEYHLEWGNDQETLENYIASLSKKQQ